MRLADESIIAAEKKKEFTYLFIGHCKVLSVKVFSGCFFLDFSWLNSGVVGLPWAFESVAVCFSVRRAQWRLNYWSSFVFSLGQFYEHLTCVQKRDW